MTDARNGALGPAMEIFLMAQAKHVVARVAGRWSHYPPRVQRRLKRRVYAFSSVAQAQTRRRED